MFRRLLVDVKALESRIKELLGGLDPLDPLMVDVKVGSCQINGTIDGIWSQALLRHRCAKLSGRDRIRLWIEHLLLNLLRKEGYPANSFFVAKDKNLHIMPVAEPLKHLEDLVDLYIHGLREPLRFFPRTSDAYARKGEYSSARNSWEGEFYPESDDPYYRLCFGAMDPLDGEFERIARSVFGPLNDHLEE